MADAGDDVADAAAVEATDSVTTDPEAAHAATMADDAEVWLVATFNLVAFSLPLVILGHASGALTDTLPELGTTYGLLLFGYLWLLLWLSTRWVFAEGGLERCRRGETGRLLVRGMVGGALVGMGFVVGIAVAIAAANVLDGMVDVPVFVFLLLLGAAAGSVVGLVVGLLFGVVDVALYRASAALISFDGN
ncbi:hypothetical protein HUG10_18720 (plasmid) [Halorarum halophilum]|uniref:DUF7965 domain-containing protein n=1 Tax=Halorarum halophilum TaxID=2743090 RepID=A0A7D5GP06_9EURY|nr:hypothetical protein [Halobaculum halophilum]QLG29644.1 hypothetical protein HUG10_18720 [Halobaculum halophilum]